MNRKFAPLFLICVSFVASPLAASATPITVPTGLHPGDQYRLAFVTSTTRDATAALMSDYNAFVTIAANTVPELVALGTTWKAIGSTTEAARDNTGTNPATTGVPVYNTGGFLVAVSNADLWDGALLAPINRNELGEVRFHFRNESVVWTGTFIHGEQQGVHGLAYPTPTTGWFDGTGGDWIDRAWDQRNSNYPFYAISGVLTVVPGDANGDGKVTGADYTIWAANFGQSGGWPQGDFTGDGKITGADYTI